MSDRIVFGLTGGIASGKSTVGKFLSEMGVDVIDMDVVSRDVMQPGSPCLNEALNVFQDVKNLDGSLNRGALADIVFSNPEKLDELTRITEPYINEAVGERIARSTSQIICVESAILIERGLHQWFRPLVLVAASPDVQVARGVARDRTTPEKIQARIQNQLSLEEKRSVADYIIENDGSLTDLKQKTKVLLDRFISKL